MKVKNYLKELHYRFLLCLLCFLATASILYLYKEQLFYFLGNYQSSPFPFFLATNLPEVFLASVKLTLFLGLYFSLPVICINLWLFFKPAFYKHEADKIKIILVVSAFLYGLTLLFTIFILLPSCWKFFQSFELTSANNGINIRLETRLTEYLNFLFDVFFTLSFLSYSSLIFFFLIVNYTINLCIKYRKLLYFSFLCLATLITPPDIFSQLFVSVLLISSYEIFLLCLFISREYKKKGE